ncbi:MAG: peptidase E, partial [Gaiellaceae bacterium]
MPEPQIVGIGGGGNTPEQFRALLRYVLSLTGKERPRVLHVPTATGDSAESIVAMYERLGALCDLSHLR